MLPRCQAALNEGKPVRTLDVQQGRAAAAQAAVPDHRQAGDVRGQRREDGFENNPLPGSPARLRGEAERAGGGDLRQDGSRDGRHEDEDKQMFLAEIGQDEPGLNRLIRAAFKLLGLQTYFTAGVKEVRAWTVASAPPARRRPA
jgi:hypothetical protein